MPFREPADDDSKEMLRHIGDQIGAVRRLQRLSQREFAARVGVNQSSQSRLEGGRTATMRLERFAQILIALGADVRITWPRKDPTYLGQPSPPLRPRSVHLEAYEDEEDGDTDEGLESA